MTMLKPWREIVSPHSDVLRGTFQQSEFAADISRVHSGTATEEYQDPALFFQRTFITEGMKLLLHSVLQRLSGKGGDPVIQLQTAFGGGKTHTLLAVYHLATAACPASQMPGVPALLDEAGLMELPRARMAVIDGIRMSPNQPSTRDGLTVNTLWGELARQLGGAEGYALLEASDRAGTSPGKDVLEALLRMAAPCVILMDEVVAYIRQFGDTPLTGGTFSSNLSFMQALTEAMKGVPNAVLLASLPESATEAGDTNGQRALEMLSHTFGRVQALWKPVGAEEAFEVVRRRLFADVLDRKAADDVCKSFAEFYRANADHFPQETQESRYAARLRSAYPIHPEVFDRLYEDWSSLDHFQRTRGVLKFMAKVIHRLWKDNSTDPLIMPGSLPLYDAGTRADIIYYLPPGWDPVVDKDIDGENAQPTLLDMEQPRFGNIQSCRRVARTIFLGSAPAGNLGGGSAYRGIDEKRIYLGAVLPSASLALFHDSLQRLQDKLYYLNTENERYWFNVHPNLRREMEDRKGRYGMDQVQPFIKSCLQGVLKQGMFGARHIFANTGDIPDDEQLRLVVLPLCDAYSRNMDNHALTAARTILEQRGDLPRQNRNRLIFLAPEYDATSRLLDQVKTCLAWQSIVTDSTEERLVLDTLQIKNARKAAENAFKVAKCSVMEAFKWLLVPYCGKNSLAETLWEKLSIPSSATNLMDEIERQLRENELVIERWAPIHLRTELQNWFWKNGASQQKALDVWQAMCRYLYLPRLSNKGVFAQTLTDGTGSRDFFALAQGQEGEKFLGFIFGKASLVVLDADLLLIAPEHAAHYENTLKAAESEETPPAPMTPSGQRKPVPDSVRGGGTASQKIVRRFIGNVALDPLIGKSDSQKIFDEVIQHLYESSGSSVSITLEIQAETSSQDGFTSPIQRIVKENSQQLKFTIAEFE